MLQHLLNFNTPNQTTPKMFIVLSHIYKPYYWA